MSAIHRFAAFLFLVFLTGTISGEVQTDTPDVVKSEVQHIALPDKCTGCSHVTACETVEADSQTPLRVYLWPVPFILGLILLVLLKKTGIRRFFLFAGILLFVWAIQLWKPWNLSEKNSDSPIVNSAVQQPVENTVADDEFLPFDDTAESAVGSDDEFAAFDMQEDGTEATNDEFAPLAQPETMTNIDTVRQSQNDLLRYVGLILLITILAGILSRFRTTRKLRIPFLLGALIYMGFYNGGCPCMISSIQDFILWMFGATVFWGSMLWFLGLMVITYFFGRVWCGWFCHLGALQDFLYKANIIKSLKSVGAQKVLKYIQIVTLIVLLVQLAVTRTNIFIHYDPFKVAFNLFSSNTTGYVLLFIMLVSSVLIYRPFCRGFCPVGLAMGWVSYLPGASVIQPGEGCIGCKTCNNVCDSGAIVRTDKVSYLHNGECIRCGACLDNCSKNSMHMGLGNGNPDYSCLKPVRE
jgi:ferredoxin